MAKGVARLYRNFRPANYQLQIEPDRKSMSFKGRVVIEGNKVGAPSKRLTLHQKKLKVASAEIVRIDKKDEQKRQELKRINTHDKHDELRLHTSDTLFPGRYRITISFSGKISPQMHGAYLCNYKDGQKKKSLIATQFESHHAREVFPCVDEPEAKALFNLTIVAKKNEIVVSNTPVKRQLSKYGKTKTTFKSSPIMSSYLLAFVLGELTYVEAKTKSGVIVRSYGTKNNQKLLDYSLDIATRSVEFFEDYFKTPYPLAKLDLVALPDFSAGAMENWGLITFRESIMLVDQTHTSIESKQSCALVIAHEVAHMWFGNLVTMKWWDDLWLNESFANLMEYEAIDYLFPEWRVWEIFCYSETNIAQRRDSLPGVQSVHTKVNHPDELGTLFDPAIVYAKGGNLLNMLKNYIGEDNFRAGLKDYFSRHKYGNTEAEDLWSALASASQKDVSQFMKNWLYKPGYPLVRVEYDPDKPAIKLSQQRLTTNSSGETTIWQIPIGVHPDIGFELLSDSTISFKTKKLSRGTNLLLNHQNRSYFIPRYENKNHFELIIKGVSSTKIEPIDRLQLLQGYSIMERALVASTRQNLELIKAYKNESEEAVWRTISGTLGSAKSLVIGTAAEKNLNSLIRDVIEPVQKNLDWQKKPDDSPQTLRLRDLILSIAAAAEHAEIIKEGLKRFSALQKPADVSPDIRSVVYYIAARYGTSHDFKKLLNLYMTLQNADEKEEIAGAITSTKDSVQIRQILGMLKKDIRLQDIPTWFILLMRNYYATDEAWKWMTVNWDWIEKNFGEDKSYDAFARYSASVLSRPEELKRYKRFFEPLLQIKSLERAIKLGIEEITTKVSWRQSNEKETIKWLSEYSQMPRVR